MGIAAKLYGDRKGENQNPLQEDGPGCKYHIGVSRRGAEKCLFLTSSSHRMSAIEIFHSLRHSGEDKWSRISGLLLSSWRLGAVVTKGVLITATTCLTEL
jgi:hypothetical protein